MVKNQMLCAVLALMFASVAQAASALPSLLREIETKYTKAGTLTAEFAKVDVTEATQSQKSSWGRIQVKQPNKFRWETTKPDPNTLVSDGKTVWQYTPPFDAGDNGQVLEGKASKYQSKLANALLTGSFSAAKDMKIIQKTPEIFDLTPNKPGAAGTVQTVRLEVDPKAKTIRRVTLKHKGGNVSEISLSNIQLGEPIADPVFRFVAPPNTDRVTN